MRIDIYCPLRSDPWSPENCNTGIGGSEEAVVYLSKALADIGHTVSVFNAVKRPARRFGNVVYQGAQSLCAGRTVDIAVVWRYPALYPRIAQAVRARRVYLWLHDAIGEARILPYIECFTKLMVLSRFHRARYPHIPNRRMFITRNGIETTHFQQVVQRNPFKLVYGSDYSRGLVHLLRCWERIKAAAPEARLSIFYGWNSMMKGRPQQYIRTRNVIGDLMNQDGIVHCGRLGHLAVAREYLSAGLWCYPCTFPEVSCISALKAQAGGAIPIVIPTGALSETVRFGYKTVGELTAFPDGRLVQRILSRWVEAVIDLLQMAQAQERIRPAMMEESRRECAWSRIAAEWTTEFESRALQWR